MFRKINAKLENLFDHNSHAQRNAHESLNHDQINFHVENNNLTLENLSYIFSNEINTENLSNLFMQLSAYFEIGFLLKKNKQSRLFQLEEAFTFSKKMEITENPNAIRLPSIEVYKVLKTKAHPLLKKFNLGHLDIDEKMFSYLIPISENHTIIVVTKTAEPWAKLKVEALQSTLMKIDFSL